MSMFRVGAGTELTGDRLFTHRVRRLVAISAVALGVIWGLAFVEEASAWILVLLAVGWVAMPVILAASLRRPSLRYALVVPVGAVSVGLVGMVVAAPEETVTGWILITAGILLGGLLGVWFWFRWLPVPRIFDDPFGWPRVALVGLHLALVLVGAMFVMIGT
ncbi:MAG: hypothetical protein U9N79_06525 [Actinomycetota bacterium]|nr:hypothetical protein [Actinomycetota bacterium]